MEAIENLAAILTVDHIDVFFVAPSDLAQTMGYTGSRSIPPCRSRRCHAQIVAAGPAAHWSPTTRNTTGSARVSP
jgi:2-keto-3-deoxy-L-rhamnonate aldolase RhmA